MPAASVDIITYIARLPVGVISLDTVLVCQSSPEIILNGVCLLVLSY